MEADSGHPQAPERSSASHLQSESNLQYPVSALTQLHTSQYLQNQNSSQNSIYTDSSKYNHAAARSSRAAYLLPSPYHLTNIFVWKVVCQFQLEHPFPDMRIVRDPFEK